MRAWLLTLVFLWGCNHVAPGWTQPVTVAAPVVEAAPPPDAGPPPPLVVSIVGEVDESDPQLIRALLVQTEAHHGDRAVVLLDTPGGLAQAAHEVARLMDQARRHGIRVDCVVDGQADSAGFYILQACHRRFMTKRSVLATHRPSVVGEVKPEEQANVDRQIEARSRAFAEHCAARLTVTFEEYQARTAGNQEWWLAWPEALAAGAVDRVVPSVDAFLAED